VPHIDRPHAFDPSERAAGGIRLPRSEELHDARSGREAIKAAIETRPDLAVLDVEMPDLGGLEVLRAMNGEGRGTRVLFVAGKPGRRDVLRADRMRRGLIE
jgi:CheY-like chemotaxis protein